MLCKFVLRWLIWLSSPPSPSSPSPLSLSSCLWSWWGTKLLSTKYSSSCYYRCWSTIIWHFRTLARTTTRSARFVTLWNVYLNPSQPIKMSGDGVFHNLPLVGSLLLLCFSLGQWERSPHHEHYGEVGVLWYQVLFLWNFDYFSFPGDLCCPTKTIMTWCLTTSVRSKRASAFYLFSTR